MPLSPIQTSDMPRRPPTKTAFPSTWECCFGRKSPEKQRTKVWFLSQTTLADPLNGRLILKAALADPLNGHQILKVTLADPLNGRLILKAALTDPLNGQLFRKTPLQTARRQVFHEKQRKTFRLFGSASSPHGMQQKAGCRETRSTAACLYINE